MMILEMFLKKLLDIPELRAEPLVEQFLAYNDKASFEKLKANYKPTGKIVPLKTIQNIQGTLVTAADPKTGSFISGAQKHFEVVQPLVKTYSYIYSVSTRISRPQQLPSRPVEPC